MTKKKHISLIQLLIMPFLMKKCYLSSPTASSSNSTTSSLLLLNLRLQLNNLHIQQVSQTPIKNR